MIIGIDCGYRTGGVALVGDDWAEVHDLPTYSEGGVDVLALMDIIKSVEKVDHIYIERQQAMPRQGVVSTFKLGYGYGQISSTCALSKVPFSLVSPAKWKRALALPKDKDAARRLAQQWFPEQSPNNSNAKNTNTAQRHC